MEMNPHRVRTADFKTVKRGLDPDEVRTFLSAVADELERAQNQSTAMEARARAAVARLQELSDGAAAQSESAGAPVAPVATSPVPEPEVEATPEPEAAPAAAPVDQSDTISRTLILAQRTADTTVAEAQAEADRLRSDAEQQSSRTLDSTREMAAQLLDEARDEARRVSEAERIVVESEVNSLKARRDFLGSDIEHMEVFLVDQRSRLRDAANELLELTERVPSGLGEVRPPLLSASDEEPAGPSGSADQGRITLAVGDSGQVDQVADVAPPAESTADASETAADSETTDADTTQDGATHDGAADDAESEPTEPPVGVDIDGSVDWGAVDPTPAPGIDTNEDKPGLRFGFGDEN